MKIVTVPCSFDNYAYLVICEETGEAAIIDPAEFYPVFSEIESSGVHLKAIYCTHHHGDHIGGLEDFLGEFPGLKVYGHESDKRRIPGLNSLLSDKSSIRIGNINGQVIHTPGHTSGSVCYVIEDAVFTGDTLFGAGCGRLFEGSPREMYDSLKSGIKPLSPRMKIYFGHEYTAHNLKFANFVDPENESVVSRQEQVTRQRELGELTTPSSLEDEFRTNPFLRCEEYSIIKSVSEKFAGEDLDPVSVFAALRRLRDGF
jgi:hydroxyacylglutathione hydrolase